MDTFPSVPPKKIAKYRVDRVLGSGAMGMVYLGYDSAIERPVAIKILHPHLRVGEHGHELEQRFLQEGRAAARCLHPNIVTIFDFGADQDMSYIVMEFVQGVELQLHLKSGIFISLPSATDICIQVLEALAHAHDRGVVHRDIKPANIILLENGSVKVSDFGVARIDTSDLTLTGYVVGTPSYISPEASQGQTVDARSDLYSVGILFFELLTRQRPARDKSLEESLDTLNDVTHLSSKNLRSIKPILRQALQANPSARFQSSREFIEQLKSIDDMDLTEARTGYFPAQFAAVDPDAGTRISDIGTGNWNKDTLDSLERSLARYVGPLARVLVRKQSRAVNSIEELVSSLAGHIPTDIERTQFIKTLEKASVSNPKISVAATVLKSGTPPPAPTTAAKEIKLADAAREHISKLLTYYLGPLANRVLQKAMKSSVEPTALITELARHIPDEKERKRFIEQASRVI